MSFDNNKSKSLDINEFKKLLSHIGMTAYINDQEITLLFNDIDRTRDEEIFLEEFWAKFYPKDYDQVLADQYRIYGQIFTEIKQKLETLNMNTNKPAVRN